MTYEDDLYGLVDDDIIGGTAFGEDEFDLAPGPTLGAAFWNNKLKGLLLLAGVYTTGALMGRTRSWQLAKNATKRTSQGIAFVGRKTGEGISNLSARADEAAKTQATRLPQGGTNKVITLSVNKGKKFYG